MAILAGNTSLALGTPAAPSLAAAGSGATLPAATYSVIVVALTLEGYRNSSVAAGIATSKTVTGADGKTFAINGGSSNKSASATQAVTLGQTLSATVTPIAGAVAYAWFVGTVGETWKPSHMPSSMASISLTEPRPEAVSAVPAPAVPVASVFT